MKPILVSEDVVPIAQFKSEAPKWLRRVSDSGHPLLITLNGKPAGVLVSPAEYDRMLERQRLLDDVAAGIADADAGRVVSSRKARAMFEARRRGRARR